MQTKIFYIITKSNWGGAQRYVYDIATSLPNDKFDISVVVGGEGILIDKLLEANIRVISIKNLKRNISFWKDLKTLYELYHLFKKEHPDIIHVNSSKAGWLGGLAGRLARVPRIIFTAHGWAFNEKRPIWQRVILYLASIFPILFSNKTICVSNAVLLDVQGAPGIHHKLQVILLGIKTPHYETCENARRILAPDATKRIWIGMVAELHNTKRVEDAIVAIKELKEFYPDILLLVAGEGEHRVFLEKEIDRYGVSKHVKLLGFVTNVASYMKAFEVFLIPSRTEALGYVLLEAGHAGLPVVASRVGGIPEVIIDQKNGILITPEHPQQIITALSKLLDNRALGKDMGKSLARRIMHDFNFERMVADTIALYHN